MQMRAGCRIIGGVPIHLLWCLLRVRLDSVQAFD